MQFIYFEKRLGGDMSRYIQEFIFPTDSKEKYDLVVREFRLGINDRKLDVAEKKLKVLRTEIPTDNLVKPGSSPSRGRIDLLSLDVEILVLTSKRRKACGCWHCVPWQKRKVYKHGVFVPEPVYPRLRALKLS